MTFSRVMQAKGLPMAGLCCFGSIAVLIVLLTGPACPAEEQPTLVPTRDVDVRYDVTRPQQP